jgi:hypothetical protein
MATPLLTATPGAPPTYNPAMAETFSWVPVEGAGRPLFAQATYLANPEDIKVSLSAGNINVSLDQLELNTDEIEGLIRTTNSSLSTNTNVFNPHNTTTYTTTALTSSLYVGEAFIFSIHGTSYAGYDQYLQIFDSGFANKIFSQIIKANENFYFEFPKGFYVEVGTVRNSLTPISHTPGNNDLMMTISTWI